MLQKVESATTLMIRSHRAVPAVLQANKRALLDLRQREPSEPAVPIALGAQHFLMGRYDEAVDWYQKSIELEPRPEAYFRRGLSQFRLGDRPAAIESFTLAVELNPHLAAELPSGIRLPD